MNAIWEHESNPKIKSNPAKGRQQRFSSPVDPPPSAELSQNGPLWTKAKVSSVRPTSLPASATSGKPSDPKLQKTVRTSEP
jgi:hypothetical protein